MSIGEVGSAVWGGFTGWVKSNWERWDAWQRCANVKVKCSHVDQQLADQWLDDNLAPPFAGAAKVARFGRSAPLRPYNKGKGHHVPAQKTHKTAHGAAGAAGYDSKTALAIPKAWLRARGISHARITGAQARQYTAYAATGEPLTWDAVVRIEATALREAGMGRTMALATAAKGVEAVKKSGVEKPVRIPWGKK